MAVATPEQAIRHPNWSMGAKISVDSATMMNKGLEIIEAHHLFGMPDERIEVIVHPQSVVHSLVTFKDGSTLAQLGAPDMRVPIAYTLGWPARIASTVAATRSGDLRAARVRGARLRTVSGAATGAPRLAAGRRRLYDPECCQRDCGSGVHGASHRLPRHCGYRRTGPRPYGDGIARQRRRRAGLRPRGAGCGECRDLAQQHRHGDPKAVQGFGMTGIVSFLQIALSFIVVISVVVFVHEFGHYWVARRNGVRVETFSIGFGPELFGRNDRHGTRWKVSAIPLGGYVKMLGDADAASTTVDITPRSRPRQLSGEVGVAAHGDRCCRPCCQFPVRDCGARAACSRSTAGRSRPPRSAWCRRAARRLPRASFRATGSSPSTACTSTSFEELQDDHPRQPRRALAAHDFARGEQQRDLTVTPHTDRDQGPFSATCIGWARSASGAPGVEYTQGRPVHRPCLDADGRDRQMIGGTL